MQNYLAFINTMFDDIEIVSFNVADSIFLYSRLLCSDRGIKVIHRIYYSAFINAMLDGIKIFAINIAENIFHSRLYAQNWGNK